MSLPDGTSVSTRGDLLRRADDAITASERSLFSVRRALPVLGWSAGLMVLLIIQLSADLDSDVAENVLFVALGLVWWLTVRLVPGRALIGHVAGAVVALIAGIALLPVVRDLDDDAARTFALVVWGLTAIGLAWAVWTYISESRRLVTDAEAWADSRRNPAHRTLDSSDVEPETATVHDVRDRADYDDVVAAIAGRHTGRLYAFGVAKPSLVLMVTGIAGLVFLLAPIAGLDDSRYAAASAISGLLLLIPWAWALLGDMMPVLAGRQVEANRVGIESRLYAVQRSKTTGAEIAAPRRSSLLGTPLGMLLLVAWIGLLVVRIRTTSGTALIIALAIVVAISVVVVVRVMRRRSRITVYPLDGSGDSVLQSPAREVALELASDGLVLRDSHGRAQPATIPFDQVLAVVPVSGLSAFGGDAVGIVTTGAPVVVAGRGIQDDPAVTGLRSRLDTA